MVNTYWLDPYFQVQVDISADVVGRVVVLADHVEPLLDWLGRVLERYGHLAHEVAGLLFVIDEVFERPESAENKREKLC